MSAKRRPVEWKENPKTGCWDCIKRSRHRDGYVVLVRDGKLTGAHRFIWEQLFGQIPDGLHVLHNCDNPSCIRPEHLRLGTHQDNMRDMVERGRQGRLTGEKNHKAVLTERQVVSIKRALAKGTASGSDLARKYGITPQSICLIKKGINWSHVTIYET